MKKLAIGRGRIRVIFGFCILLWGNIVVATAQPRPEPEQQWFEVFGYWTRGGGLETTLLVNNPTAGTQELGVSVFDYRNRLLAERTLIIDPSGSLSLALSEWVPRGSFGYARVIFPGAVCMLPVQGVITGRESSWSYDFRDGRAVRSGTRRIQGLAPSLPAGSRRDEEEFVLTNLGDEKQKGELIFEGDGKPSRLKWSLKAGETRIFQAPRKVVDRRRSMIVSVVPEDAGAAILALGYRQLASGGFIPVRFQPETPLSSGELGGFFGSNSRLLLWNPSPDASRAELLLHHRNGSVTQRQIWLEPESISEFELAGMMEDPDPEGGAILVRSAPDQRLQGMLVDREPQLNSSALKDTEVDTRAAYSLPVRLGDDLSTRLRIFNPLEERVTICLFVFLDGEGFTYPLKSLGPREYGEIDLAEARDSALVGEIGRTLPSDGKVGQVKLVLHTEPDSNFRKRLLAMGVIEDREHRSAVTFQGCATCPPVLTRVVISPSRIEGFVGATRSFDVLANYDDGGLKIVNVTSSSNVVASPSTVVRVDGDELDFLRPGTASLTASAFDCLEVEATEPGTFGELDCSCSRWGFLYGQSFVRSKSTLLTVHLKAFLPFNWLGADPSPLAHCLYLPPGPLPIYFTRDLVYKGDDRNYSSSYGASSRARMLASLGVSSLQNQNATTKSIGQSRSYADNALVGDNRITAADEDGVRLDCDLWHDAATQNVSTIQVVVSRVNERIVNVRFTGSTGLPLLISPSIDWDLTVRLEVSGDKILWSVNGWEDGFPGFEMYIGGTPIYRRKPTAREESFKLFDGIGDVLVSARGEIR